MSEPSITSVQGDDAGGASISHAPVSPSSVVPPPATSGRKDYDQLVSFRGMKPGEPYFLLKGHDQVAADTVRDYACRIRAAGADVAVVESALQLADKIDAYPEKRLVDSDHLMDHEARQLRYLFNRRAQAFAGDAAPQRATGVAIVLAEQRAAQTILSRLRPALTLLLTGGSFREDGAFVFHPDARRRGDPKDGLPPSPCPIATLRAYLDSAGHALPGQDAADV